MFKKITLSVLLLFASTTLLLAQVGIGTTTPASGAILDIHGDNGGIVIPRVELVETTNQAPIIGPAPVTGLMVYNIAPAVNDVSPGFYYWNGAAWDKFSIESNSSPYSSVTLNNDEDVTSSTFTTIPGMTLTFTATKPTAFILLTASGYGDIDEPLTWIEMRVFNETTNASYGGTQANVHSSFWPGNPTTIRNITSWSASFSKLISDLTVGVTYTFRVEARVFAQGGTTSIPVAFIYPSVGDIDASHLTLTVSQ